VSDETETPEPEQPEFEDRRSADPFAPHPPEGWNPPDPRGEPPVFPLSRFIAAGATEEEAATLEAEFDAKSTDEQYAIAAHYESIAEGDLQTIIETRFAAPAPDEHAAIVGTGYESSSALSGDAAATDGPAEPETAPAPTEDATAGQPADVVLGEGEHVTVTTEEAGEAESPATG
jgi:hypothetical protein